MKSIAFAFSLLILVACGASTPPVKKGESAEKKVDHAAKARQSVNNALKALRESDEGAFRAQLSKARASEYSQSWFELWVKEVGQFNSAYASGWEQSKDGTGGKVVVVVNDRHRHQVRVRVRLEDGQWRWDEK